MRIAARSSASTSSGDDRSSRPPTRSAAPAHQAGKQSVVAGQLDPFGRARATSSAAQSRIAGSSPTNSTLRTGRTAVLFAVSVIGVILSGPWSSVVDPQIAPLHRSPNSPPNASEARRRASGTSAGRALAAASAPDSAEGPLTGDARCRRRVDGCACPSLLMNVAQCDGARTPR